MSDALTPLRHVYGVEPAGAPLAPGGAEHELLRQMRDVLDTRPARRPDAFVVDAVLARAAEASARDDAPVSDPVLASLAVALVLPLTGAAPESAETALLVQTAEALGRLPTHRPDAGVIEAVLASATDTSAATLDAVRHVYDGAEAPALGSPASVEVALLRQSREVVERALVSRPQPRPSEGAVAAVLARAAEASARDDVSVSDPALAPLAMALGLPLTGAAPESAETALLVQTAEALDRLPTYRPGASAIDAVLAKAAAASRSATRRATDRTAARPSRRRPPVGVWAGGAGLMLAALVAVVVLPSALRTGEVQEAVTVAEVQAPEREATSAPLVALDAPDEEEPSAPPPVASPSLAGAAAVSAFVPVREAVPQRSTPTPQPRVAAPAPTPQAAPPWDADEDLRTLALRLDKLDRGTEGLAWDEPAEPFGVPSGDASRTAMPGVQAVRAGAAPARVVLRPDSSQSQR